MELIEILKRWCYFDDNDLVWLSEYVLHLSGDIFLNHGPCFHHLTHHSKHFNKAVQVLKRSLAGLNDTPINQACRASLLCASDSGDRREAANKGRKSGDNVKRASACWRWTCCLTPAEKSVGRVLIANLSKDCESPPEGILKQSPVGQVPSQRRLLCVLFTSLKTF